MPPKPAEEPRRRAKRPTTRKAAEDTKVTKTARPARKSASQSVSRPLRTRKTTKQPEAADQAAVTNTHRTKPLPGGGQVASDRATPATQPAPWSSPATYADAGPCQVCGREPTANVTFRRNTGMVVIRRSYTLTGPFCRDCGTAAFRNLTNATLITGWWGLISFFVNFGYVIGNFGDYGWIRKLSAPSMRAGVPSQPAWAPGRPLLARGGPWVSIGLLAFAVLAVVLQPRDSGTPTSSLKGQCVNLYNTGDALYRRVLCTDTHDGKVVAVVSQSSACPPQGDYYLEFKKQFGRRTVACVDESDQGPIPTVKQYRRRASRVCTQTGEQLLNVPKRPADDPSVSAIDLARRASLDHDMVVALRAITAPTGDAPSLNAALDRFQAGVDHLRAEAQALGRKDKSATVAEDKAASSAIEDAITQLNGYGVLGCDGPLPR